MTRYKDLLFVAFMDVKRFRRFLIRAGQLRDNEFREEIQKFRPWPDSIINELLEYMDVEYYDMRTSMRVLAYVMETFPHKQPFILWNIVPVVCKTLDPLLVLMSMIPRNQRKWGRNARRALEAWFFTHTPYDLAYDMMMHTQRRKFTSCDLLRLAHPRPSESVYPIEYNELFATITDKWHPSIYSNIYPLLSGLNMARSSCSPTHVRHVIEVYGLHWRHINRALLKNGCVWNTLLRYGELPYEDVLKQLPSLIEMEGINVTSLCSYISDEKRIQKSQVTPLTLIQAIRCLDSVYAYSHPIIQTLEKAYELSFVNLNSTSLRYMISMDVSGSMGCYACNGAPSISALDASGVLAMCFSRKELNAHFTTFQYGVMKRFDIMPCDCLGRVLYQMTGLPFDHVDCNKPIQHAIDNNTIVDCFVIVTDDLETRIDSTIDKLKLYQQSVNQNAKMVLISASAKKPRYPSQIEDVLQFAGVDSNMFAIIQSFAVGDL